MLTKDLAAVSRSFVSLRYLLRIGAAAFSLPKASVAASARPHSRGA